MLFRSHVFTYGHLDHIGSFRHFIHRIPAPVYGSKFTIGMLDKSMADADTDFQPDFRVMDPLSHEIVQVSKHFSVELIRVNHSILVALRTADGHGAPVLPGRPGAGKAAACPPGERALTRFYESPMSPRIPLTSRCRLTAAARVS